MFISDSHFHVIKSHEEIEKNAVALLCVSCVQKTDENCKNITIAAVDRTSKISNVNSTLIECKFAQHLRSLGGVRHKKVLSLNVCANCKNTTSNKTCKRCRRTEYCNVTCQLSHWKDHKNGCYKFSLRNLGDHVNTPTGKALIIEQLKTKIVNASRERIENQYKLTDIELAKYISGRRMVDEYIDHSNTEFGLENTHLQIDDYTNQMKIQSDVVNMSCKNTDLFNIRYDEDTVTFRCVSIASIDNCGDYCISLDVGL
jgi:hypothetical protein